MEQNEFLEGNVLIAEFMASSPDWAFSYEKEGYRFYINPWSSKAKTYDEDLKETGFYLVPTCNFNFNSSWDWIMPVLDKIEKQGLKCNIGTTSCTIYSAKYNVEPVYADTKIKAVWLAAIDYIKWLNESITPTHPIA